MAVKFAAGSMKGVGCESSDDTIAGLGTLSPKRRTLQVDMKQN
jgi:hypothetical protein